MDVQFAAAKILQEIYEKRSDWAWFNVIVNGGTEVTRSSGQWQVRFTLVKDQCEIELRPPDDLSYFHINVEHRDFELSDPKVFDVIEKYIDDWIDEKEKQ